ncbi:MAG TPA: hypothetical protein VMU99_06740 [Acidimicrobiales bacterium]|nr:hypothetical protein [Acidimicrobiales bacterium]
MGDAAYVPRVDIYAPNTNLDEYYRWGSMTSVSRSNGVVAVRIKSGVLSWPSGQTQEKYCVEPGLYSGIILAYSIENGEPLALMQDGYLQHMRVGGTAGIGTDHLARRDSRRLGILGSGGMARTYLDSIRHVRELDQVSVFSPTAAHREAFAREVTSRYSINVEAVNTAEEAVRDMDIVATCTDSIVPTFEGGWLAPGTHIVTLSNKEIGGKVLEKADVIIESGYPTLVGESEPGMTHEVVGAIASYVIGQPDERARVPRSSRVHRSAFPVLFPYGDPEGTRGRTSEEQVTLFFNNGTQGLQFASVAGSVYRLATEKRFGASIPLDWFLQDIRD